MNFKLEFFFYFQTIQFFVTLIRDFLQFDFVLLVHRVIQLGVETANQRPVLVFPLREEDEEEEGVAWSQ